MTKLKKYSLEDLEKTFQCMNELEKAMLIGGGMDYVFDSMGRIKSMSTNDFDYSRALCGSGNSLVYNFKNELVISSYSVHYKTHDNKTVDGTSTRMEGGDIGLFEFLADNTEVEWSAQFNGGNSATSSNPCVITTTNDKQVCMTSVESDDYNTFVHSHPNASEKNDIANEEWSDADWEFYYGTKYKEYGLRTNGKTKYV